MKEKKRLNKIVFPMDSLYTFSYKTMAILGDTMGEIIRYGNTASK